MKRKATQMDASREHNIPECSVIVRRLTLGEIGRMTINPFFISNRCGGCKKLAYYEPKCTTCSVSYHYGCARRLKTCCDLPILLHEDRPFRLCPKCNEAVMFGPSCVVCKAKYHGYCLTPFDQCCRLNICELPPQRFCGKCQALVATGPTCPLCKNTYHLECVGKEMNCCDIKIDCVDENYRYKCKKCHRNTTLGSLMCQLCGEVYHNYCIGNGKHCCGKRVPLEIFFIPSFKSVVNYFKLVNKRRAELKRPEDASRIHAHALRSFVKNVNQQKRARKKSTGCQTNALDSIAIVSVKSEAEDREVEIHSSPPLLERETSCDPEPSSSCLNRTESSAEGDETLKNLFDFLFNMVKKFPPQLQTQVKVDLFKTVTEAEMKLRCNMVEELRQNGK